MPINNRSVFNNTEWRIAPAGLAGLVLFGSFSAIAAVAGLWKVLVISWVAFVAMAGGAALGASGSVSYPRRLVWGYGLASGAMVTSSAVFLLPQAIGLHPRIGGFGVAIGLLVGYAAHIIGHRLSHIEVGLDLTGAQITAHALAAGAIIGLVYGSMPSLGLLLGLAIVSHKGPAGYAAAKRIYEAGNPVSALLLPSAAVGITAIPAALLPIPNVPAISAAVFGFAAGVFLHVAMDFLPSCEVGGEVDEVCSLSEHSHELLDALRIHAVASTLLGGGVVFVAWVVIA